MGLGVSWTCAAAVFLPKTHGGVPLSDGVEQNVCVYATKSPGHDTRLSLQSASSHRLDADCKWRLWDLGSLGHVQLQFFCQNHSEGVPLSDGVEQNACVYAQSRQGLETHLAWRPKVSPGRGGPGVTLRISKSAEMLTAKRHKMKAKQTYSQHLRKCWAILQTLNDKTR